MKWSPVIGAKKGRGDLFFSLKDEIITIWLGDPQEIESEFIMQIGREIIPDIISTLRLIQEIKERA